MPDGPGQARTQPEAAQEADRPLPSDSEDDPPPPLLSDSECELPPAEVQSQRWGLASSACPAAGAGTAGEDGRGAAAGSRTPRRTRGAARLVSRAATQVAVFFELFAGAAALSAAVQDLAPSAHVLKAGDAWRDEQQDLLDDQYLRHCVGRACQALWRHQAPACQTFSQSRRSDKWGTVRQLRSDRERRQPPSTRRRLTRSLVPVPTPGTLE